MATRKLVPRATGEGGIGKATKRWGDSYLGNVDATSVNIAEGETYDINGNPHTHSKADGIDTFHGVEAIGVISFDNSSHVLTLASVTYWYKGTKYTTASSVTCDLDLTADRDHASAILTANTLYYIRFKDTTGKLYWSPSFWDLHEAVPVATVFWNGSAGAVSKESHGYTRNIDWHIWAHLTVGARYGSGLSLTYPTAAVDGSLQIESGTIYDEDITINIGQQTTMRGWYRASAGAYTFADYALPYLGTAGAPVYLDTDTYALTTFASNKYICYWVFGTADQDRPIAIIPSHVAAPYSQAADARVEVQPAISGVNPEWKLIYRWIYSGDGQFIESTDYRLQTSLAGGVSASTTAGAVSFTPAGNVVATNVQSAIEELDTEKVSHSLATAENDVLVGAPTPFGSWVKKTIAEFKTILGLGSAAYTASTAYDPAGTATGKIAASISDGDTTHAPDGNSVFDALALKANLISPSFTTPALGTPSSGTLTNCTGLPQAGVTGLTTSDSPAFGTVKLSGLTDGYIPKHTSDAVGLVNSPIYTNGTNVGIGTTSFEFEALLKILQSASNFPALYLQSVSTTASGWGTNETIRLKNTDATVGNHSGIAHASSNNNVICGIDFINVDHTYKGAIGFGTRSLVGEYGYRMYISETGLTGFKTTTPASTVSVLGNLSVGANYAAVAAPTNGAIFEGNVGIGCSAATQAIVNNGNLAFYRSEGANRQIFIPVYNTAGTNTTGGGGTLWIGTGRNGYQDESTPPFDGTSVWGSAIVFRGFSETNYRASIEFFTKTGTSITPSVSRLLISHDGNVGIGTISPASKLSISGNLSVGSNYAAVAAPTNGAIFEGNVGIGTSSPSTALDVNSDILRLRTAKTPASASAAGNAGDICWDSSYIYVCIATNTWKRSAIATW